MLHCKITAFIIVLSVAISAPVKAQESHSYKLVPQTVYEKKPVTVTRWVDETVNEKKTVTTYKMVWQTETRERRNVEYKPVRKTSFREERVTVRKPVVENLVREKRTEETTYDEVTEMRDEQYTVRKPVIETQMREERVTVRKPVTQKLIEVQRTTTYKPVMRTQTQMVPTQAVVDQIQEVPDPNQRARMRRLDSGYYNDSATGQTVYRRRGLHWVQPTVSVPAAATVPALVPQQVEQVDYVPETVEKRKPVEFTSFVEQVETRKVPVEIERMVERTETRRIPVTVKVPRTKVTVEQVPYTKTSYVDEVTVTKVPYTETTYEKVETVEPYEVEVPRWIPETKEVDVPRKVSKRVEYTEMRDVPRTIMVKVPLDICGNPIETTDSVADAASTVPALESEFSSAYGTTTSRKVEQESRKSVLSDDPATTKPEGYKGELKLIEPKAVDETSARSIDVPDTTPTAKKPGMELKSIVPSPTNSGAELKPAESESDSGSTDNGAESQVEESVGGKAALPEDTPSETGDENAADRPPVPQTELSQPE